MSHGPILCGVDFSEDSRQALRIAGTVAAALERELLVVTVLDPLIAEAGKVRDGEAFAEQTASDLRSFASDAFLPFRDNVDRAAQSCVRYVSQPGGSVRDDLVVAAADEYWMVMAFSGLRLFHH